MNDLALNNDSNPYLSAYKQMNQVAAEASNQNSENTSTVENSKLHNAAVNVAVSQNNINLYLNVKSLEFNSSNLNAQEVLTNILGENNEFLDFFAGKTMENGFSLESIGYTGKPLLELNQDEAKSLIDEGGFFSIENTSNRVSSFVLNLAGDNLEGLQEARKGIVQGFEEALKLFGGELPEISHKTQERTLEMIDKKIEELTKTNLEKEVEANLE